MWIEIKIANTGKPTQWRHDGCTDLAGVGVTFSSSTLLVLSWNIGRIAGLACCTQSLQINTALIGTWNVSRLLQFKIMTFLRIWSINWWRKWYDGVFVNWNWVDTRWQQYSAQLHTNSTQNGTKPGGSSTVHSYTQTVHRTALNPVAAVQYTFTHKQHTERH